MRPPARRVEACPRRPRPDLVLRNGDEELHPQVTAVTDPAGAPDVDWVFLGVKAHQTPGAPDSWRTRLLAHQTPGAPNWLRALDHGVPVVVL